MGQKMPSRLIGPACAALAIILPLVGCSRMHTPTNMLSTLDAFHRRVVACAAKQGMRAHYDGDFSDFGGPGLHQSYRSGHWTLSREEPETLFDASTYPLERVMGYVWISEDGGTVVPLDDKDMQIHLHVAREEAASLNEDDFCECMSQQTPKQR
jgi:hypothetical protein